MKTIPKPKVIANDLVSFTKSLRLCEYPFNESLECTDFTTEYTLPSDSTIESTILKVSSLTNIDVVLFPFRD